MKILLLSAHTDDAETGCGGSATKFIDEGDDVYYAAFSLSEDSLPEGLPKDILLSEAKLATKVLGIKPANLFFYKYPVRKFPQFRQEILEDLVRLNKEINPDFIFLPSMNDMHQDHHVIATEGFRAFKISTILGYEIPSNNITFTATAFISLEKSHVEKKIQALKCYESQRLREESLGRKRSNPERLMALSQVRGYQIRADYAEAFNLVRWIIR